MPWEEGEGPTFLSVSTITRMVSKATVLSCVAAAYIVWTAAFVAYATYIFFSHDRDWLQWAWTWLMIGATLVAATMWKSHSWRSVDVSGWMYPGWATLAVLAMALALLHSSANDD